MAGQTEQTTSNAGEHHGQAAAAAMTDALAAQVQAILEAAERAAAEIQREVEEETIRRAAAIRLEAETEAQRIRTQAQAEVAAYLLERRQAIDAFARDRIEQLTRLTDALLTGSQAAIAPIDEAARARRALEDLLAAIAAAAEAAAHVATAEPEDLTRPAPNRAAHPAAGQ